MPSVPLHLVVDHHAFSSHYVWYSHCHLLRRQSLETHVDEPVMAFPGDIQRLEANDFLCVVATKNNMFSFTLWASTSPDYVAERVRRWILTPNRLVYETVDGIYEWDFTNTYRLASGTLIGASDTRILRENDNGARVWENGVSASAIRHLWPDDSLNEPRRRVPLFWIKPNRLYGARTTRRLERLMSEANATQLNNHA